MNQVNLIGKVSSAPKFTEFENGKRVAKFTLATNETYLDAQGKPKSRKHWHKVSAWGRWAKVLEELATVGVNVAIEGKLISRFYQQNGQKQVISEVEVNDLVLM
ncbi:MAG: hypothetical protein RL264_1728 [Bacteroidota bacterium]|jgi:single-strand DNA-binding protein